MFHALGTLQGKNRVEWLLARAPCWKRTDRQTQEEESKSEWPKKRISEGRSKSPGNSFKWVSYMVWFMLFFGFGFVFFNDVTAVNHWLLPYPKLHLPPREEEAGPSSESGLSSAETSPGDPWGGPHQRAGEQSGQKLLQKKPGRNPSVTGPSKCGAVNPQPGLGRRAQETRRRLGGLAGWLNQALLSPAPLVCTPRARRAKYKEILWTAVKTPLPRKSNSWFFSFAFLGH